VVLASRRPRHPVGWLLLGLGVSIGFTGFADSYVLYGQLVRSGALPAARWLVIYSPAVTLAGVACVSFVLLLTPTGSLPSPRWRWWARVAAAAPVVYLVAITLKSEAVDPAYRSVTNPLGLQALQLPITIAHIMASVIIVVAVVVGALSLVVRFRRARGVERQQLRWVALAAVLGLGQLLGRDSSLVVAAATLAVAAVFQPARRRIQRAVDQRFNRRRYDAARTIAAFSARLREEVDLATLTGDLLAVVEQTMQPTTVSLWLRLPAERSTQRTVIDA
jgi:hypothetical protein